MTNHPNNLQVASSNLNFTKHHNPASTSQTLLISQFAPSPSTWRTAHPRRQSRLALASRARSRPYSNATRQNSSSFSSKTASVPRGDRFSHPPLKGGTWVCGTRSSRGHLRSIGTVHPGPMHPARDRHRVGRSPWVLPSDAFNWVGYWYWWRFGGVGLFCWEGRDLLGEWWWRFMGGDLIIG